MRQALNTLWIRNLLYSLVLLTLWLFWAGDAAAATPKEVSVIEGNHIRLKHVFDGVTESADHILAPAPSPGGETVLGPDSLNRIARAFGLSWRASTAMDKTVIKRSATVIPYARIVKDVRAALAPKLAGKFELELYNRSSDLTLPSTIPGTTEIRDLSYDPVRSSFTATLVIAPGDVNSRKLPLSGQAHRLSDIPVLTRRLRAGDVIGAGDLHWIEMRTEAVNKDVLVSSKDLVGLSPRKVLKEGQPIRATEVQPPVIVSRGDIVTMILTTPMMSLTAQGRALNDGAEGEMVRIKNTNSNQVVEATVVGPQKVTVTPAQNRAL